MKTLILLSVLLIMPLNAMATNYYVNNRNGSASDSNAGTNPSLPWLTIGNCASTIAAGDTCTVYAGTYNEDVSISAGGVGAYKTFQVNGADVVIVRSFTLGSHTKLIGNCTVPRSAGSCGFTIQNPSSPGSSACVAVGSSTDVFVTNNTMYACASGSGGGAMITINSGASFVYVQGNTMTYSGRTSTSGTASDGVATDGSHILIENNDISHYRLGINYRGTYSVFRNNTLHDQYETDSGQHTDSFFSEPASATNVQYNVIEGNRQNNAVGPNAKAFLLQGDVCSGHCYNVIIRYNVVSHIDSTATTDDNAFSSTNPGFHHVKAYNNTWVDTHRGGPYNFTFTNYYMSNSIYPADLNSIFYYPAAVSSFNPYASDSSTDSTFNYGHALAYCTGGCTNLYGHLYSSGSFASDPGNIVADPKFVNYSTNDFHLQSGSPAINAGTYLTTVANADTGSGTSLVVDDAAYFQDGYGLIGVQRDWIRVGASTTVQITAVNYSTNTLTLASSVSRADGDPVYLYKKSDGVQVLFGSVPDIGAFPFTPSGAPPVVSISILP